jgi:hypothetical protein
MAISESIPQVIIIVSLLFLSYLLFFRQEKIAEIETEMGMGTEIETEIETERITKPLAETESNPGYLSEIVKKENGKFTNWEEWSNCDKTCGSGLKERKRTYIPASNGGIELEDRDVVLERIACNEQGCPEDGKFTDWEEWNKCNKECGGGTQYRNRTYIPAKNGGIESEDKDNLSEIRKCNNQNCPVDGYLSEWNNWSNCGKECGGGSQSRERIYNPAQFGGVDLDEAERIKLIENRNCNDQNCPVDGSFSNWSEWSICDKSCGNGTQSRSRTYTPATDGGVDLADINIISETRACNTHECPVDGIFTPWSNWGSCTKSCGGGTQNRTRTYTPAINGGVDLADKANINESRACNTQLCPAPKVPSTKIIDTNLHTYTMLDIKSPSGKYRFVWQPKSYLINVYNLSDGFWSSVTSIYIKNNANNAALGTYNNNFAAYNSSITTSSIMGTSPSDFQRIVITDNGDVVFENVFGDPVGIAIANGTKLNFL